MMYSTLLEMMLEISVVLFKGHTSEAQQQMVQCTVIHSALIYMCKINHIAIMQKTIN